MSTSSCLRLMCLTAGLLGACSAPGERTPVDVPAAPVLPGSIPVAQEVGRLLSTDAAASAAARQRLQGLSGADREHLLAHAARIPHERDPRWLDVLDAHHALPALTPAERLTWLLTPGRAQTGVLRMRTQAGLIALAREAPGTLLVHVEARQPGHEAVALALGQAQVHDAVPLLLRRYRQPADARERELMAEALAQAVGEGLRPRTQGTSAQIQADAERIEAWWHQNDAARRAAPAAQGGAVHG